MEDQGKAWGGRSRPGFLRQDNGALFCPDTRSVQVSRAAFCPRLHSTTAEAGTQPRAKAHLSSPLSAPHLHQPCDLRALLETMKGSTNNLCLMGFFQPPSASGTAAASPERVGGFWRC